MEDLHDSLIDIFRLDTEITIMKKKMYEHKF